MAISKKKSEASKRNWSRLTPLEKTHKMSRLGKSRWEGKTAQERLAYSQKMYAAKIAKRKQNF